MIKTMTTKELSKKVINQESLFILDVRSKENFADWKIEGKNFSYLNVPYFELLDGVDNLVDQLPEDLPIVVVCAKGGSSTMVSEMLAEKGFSVFNLSGGMRAWSEEMSRIKLGDLTGGGELYQFARMGKGCLSYMVISAGKAAVIDPARMIDEYIDFAKEKNAEIIHVFDTHLHADHISGGKVLSEKTNATYWLPPADATEVEYSYEPLKDKETIQVGGDSIEIQALHTPGHTQGSTSFIIDEAYLLSGDMLFIDSIGRPDLAGEADAWVNDLRTSLYDRYGALSEDLIVLPGHFMNISEFNDSGSVAAKLGCLFKENHGLNVEDQEEFRKLVTENLPKQPNAYQDIRQVNMGNIKPNLEDMRDMEVGPNRCAVR